MASLESILNVAIPVGVIFVFIGLIYWKLKEPLDTIGGGVWKILGKMFDSLSSSLSGNTVTEVTYK